MLVLCASVAGCNGGSEDGDAQNNGGEARDDDEVSGAGAQDAGTSRDDGTTGADDSPSDADDDPGDVSPAPATDDLSDDNATDEATAPTDDDASDDDGTTPNEGDTCEQRTVPTTPLRRLSSDEYHNTLESLFGSESWRVLADSRFPPTPHGSGFSSDAEANIVNTAESNAIEDNAERIAQLIDAEPEPFLRELLPCDLSDGIDDGAIDACVDAFIADFGMRVSRRPLTDGEVSIARDLYDGVREEQSASFAFAALVQYFVQSPALLYRTERGTPEVDAPMIPLSGYEQASRLSYLLTGNMPDDELFAAAEAGELNSAAQVRAQAERLLSEDRFFEVLERFHRDWLQTHGFEWKPPEEFPDFEAASGSLNAEQARFVRHVLNDGDGRIETLLGSRHYPVDATLASYYGVEAPAATDEDWVVAELDDRRGLLTQASLMATLAGSNMTNPIHRGAFVQTQILCRTLPALPGNIDIQTPLQDTSDLPTARQRLSPLLENGQCAGCHTVINPVGLAFENYDAAGRWRDRENGTAIDGSGTLRLDGADVEFDGPLELADAIAVSDEARRCYALNWFRMAMGRPEFEEDACSLEPLQRATADSGGDVREMILALVETDAFRHIRRVEQ